jgi:hypothetical protein
MQDQDFEPVAIPQEPLAALQASLKPKLISFEKLGAIFLWLPMKLIAWWQVLHSNQKIYLLAVILGISQDQLLTTITVLDPNIGILIVGSIAMVGMLRELLNIFTQVWQTLLGKSIIFIIYVIIGNFTLAVAARKVNYITGVDPESLIYAQGFTTVLVLPLWLLLLTAMSLILLFTLGNLWFLFLKVVNLLRLHPINIGAGERFSVLFIFIRLLLISPIMVTLIQPLNWYKNELNIEIPGVISKQNDADDHAASKDSTVSTLDEEIDTEQVTVAVSTDDVAIIGAENKEDNVKFTNFDRAIAAFVFEYETFQRSRCAKTDAERVSIIGEEIILVAEKVEGHALGYKFSARECILRDYE